MKCISYVRHAKSSWSDPLLRDFDRPLNKRGKNDAPFMAQQALNLGLNPQLMISSPAKRAIETARYFKSTFPTSKLIVDDQLYHGDIDELENIIFNINENIKEVMVFAHNPGLTYLINKYAVSPIDNVPTSGLFSLESEANKWDLFFNKAAVSQFFYPKFFN